MCIYIYIGPLVLHNHPKSSQVIHWWWLNPEISCANRRGFDVDIKSAGGW